MTAHVDRYALIVRNVPEPVLVAPHGDHFHRAQKLNPGDFLEFPACGTEAERWVPVEPALAEMLGREPCGHCWDGKPLQLTISDTEGEPSK